MTSPTVRAAVLAALSGLALPALADGPFRSPYTLAAAQARGVVAAPVSTAEAVLRLDPRDRALLASRPAIDHDFSRGQRAGVQERSGYLLVRVKSPERLAAQIAREQAGVRAMTALRGSPAALAGASAALPAGAGLAELRTAVDQRLAHARARFGSALSESFTDIDEHRLRLPDGWTEEQLASFLMDTGDYEYAAPDWRVWPVAIPNDPLVSQQYHHGAAHLNSYFAWDFATGDPNLITAYCDTGIDIDHPDLLNRVGGFNAVSNLAETAGGSVSDAEGHGSNVAGCGAARGNNATGISGMGWNFKIMPVKVSEAADGSAFIGDISQGCRWAADNGAKSISASYGGVAEPSAGSTGTYCRNRGALLSWASGNENVNAAFIDYPDLTVVGATSTNTNRASFSNYGIGLDIMAPGVNVRTTNRTGGYSNATGTSFSTPLINGSLALIWSANPALTPAQVEQILFDTARDKGAAGKDDFYGWGLADVGLAVATAAGADFGEELPVLDLFDSGTLDTAVWPVVSGAVLSADALNEPSPTSSLKLAGTASITTDKLMAATPGAAAYTLRFQAQHRGVEAGKTLLVEYADFLGNFAPLMTLTSDGTDQDHFRQEQVNIPFPGLSDDLKVRLTAQGADATDAWFIDDFRVGEYEGVVPNWLETFEATPDTTIDWSQFAVSRSTDADGEPSGAQSALLTGGQTIQTAAIRTSDLFARSGGFDGFFSYWVQNKGAEVGDSLRVEYKDANGLWQLVEEIPAGTDGVRLELRQQALPVFAFSDDFRLRFTNLGANADDRWFIDNVYVGFEEFTQPPLDDCPSDLNGDGFSNFADVSLFVSSYTTANPIADINGDGFINFADVSAFVTAFSAGCS